MMPPAKAAGTSRTTTAPSPKGSSDKPELGQQSRGIGETFDRDGVEIDDFGDQQGLRCDGAVARSAFSSS